MTMTTIDLFAGLGGWDEGARQAGLPDPIGIEFDKAACATRHAAGHLTIRTDVSTFPVEQIGFIDTLIASPPCQAFSVAGTKRGLGDMEQLLACATDGTWDDEWADPRSGLVLQPLRWAAATRPRMILLEQVPPVLPLWERFAATWEKMGYRSWVGILNSADFGVPQTRKRAILIARLDCQPLPPEATHAKTPEPGLFGVLEPWVSMADALGWGPGAVGFPRRDDKGGDGFRERDRRDVDKPAFTITEKGRSWTRTGASPQSWWQTRPATTIVGSFRPDVVAAPGWRTSVDGPRQDTPDSVIITAEQGLVLQSFRSEYPVQGSKTSQWRQIGNAIPPLLAQRIFESQIEAR